MIIRINSQRPAEESAEIALKLAKRNGGKLQIQYKDDVLTVHPANDLQTLVDWFKIARGEK